MKELDKVIKGRGEVKGYTFTQVKMSKYAYIYVQKYDETGEVHSYEVFERKINKQFDCVSYPKSTSFGSWAWSCKAYNDAVRIFDEINKRREGKEDEEEEETD